MQSAIGRETAKTLHNSYNCTHAPCRGCCSRWNGGVAIGMVGDTPRDRCKIGCMARISQRQYALAFLVLAIAGAAFANQGAGFVALMAVSSILSLGFFIRSFLPRGD